MKHGRFSRGLMPLRMPQLDGFSLASAWQPAHEVSGDYLAAFKLNESRAALCVADVAGKGFPAALLMSNMQAALKSLASENVSPGALCMKLNGIMCSNTPCVSSSLLLRRTRISQHKLTYTNAGHNPPMLMRSNGECISSKKAVVSWVYLLIRLTRNKRFSLTQEIGCCCLPMVLPRRAMTW
jgi:sigma-B regulation protein RsbU (phosphoserine phosphatase)